MFLHLLSPRRAGMNGGCSRPGCTCAVPGSSPHLERPKTPDRRWQRICCHVDRTCRRPHSATRLLASLGSVREYVCHSGRRGARLARREERAYREYVSDEQRSQAGCIGGQSGTLIRGRVLISVRLPNGWTGCDLFQRCQTRRNPGRRKRRQPLLAPPAAGRGSAAGPIPEHLSHAERNRVRRVRRRSIAQYAPESRPQRRRHGRGSSPKGRTRRVRHQHRNSRQRLPCTAPARRNACRS